MSTKLSKHCLLAALLALVAGLATAPAMADTAINRDADEILRSMSTFVAGTKSFSVSMSIGNEVISKEGEKLQFNSSSTLVLQRPARFHATRQGRFADVELFYDGKTLSLYGRNMKAFLQKEVAGSTDDAIAAIENTIGIDMPGTDLLIADPYAALSEGITSSGYHGIDYVQGVECHHLSFREDQVDWQLWVRTGDQPLPMKYVITTKWLTGAPQYSIELSDWNLAPAVPADRFTFAPPQGARKLDSIPVNEAGEMTTDKEEMP